MAADIAYAAGQEAPSHLPLRNVVAVGLGNALEFYDFITFSFFSVQIGHCFFPAAAGGRGLLYSLAIFGVGFLTRPLGGIVIGMYGDRAGRRPAMILSFTLMGCAVVGTALIPPYAVLGPMATVMLVVCRLTQGFALGGEVGPSTAFLIEAAPPLRRGLYVTLQGATQQVAVLTAGTVGLVLASLLSPEALDSWGWRAAFLLGAAIVPFGLALRRNLPETLGRETPKALGKAPSRVRPVIIVASLMLLASGTISTYAISYMSTYAQDSLHLSPRLAFIGTIVEGIVTICALPLAGYLSDRVGRRPVTLTGRLLLLVAAFPGYLLLDRYPSAIALYAVVAVWGAFGSVSAIYASITESLPAAARSGTFAILYALAISVFGGSAQFVIKYLIDATGSRIAPAWYWMAALAIGIVGALLMPETAPIRVGDRSRAR